MTGNTDWCFPARDAKSHLDVKTVSKQVGDQQHMFKDREALKGRRNDDSLVLARGANGNWTPNDLRRTGATMMQALGITPEVVDRCQNHVLKGSGVRRHYLTHQYTAEKRDALARLGVEIEEILNAPSPAAGVRGGTVRSQTVHQTPNPPNTQSPQVTRCSPTERRLP